MKYTKALSTTLFATLLILSGCQTAPTDTATTAIALKKTASLTAADSQLTKGLMHIDDNHAVLTVAPDTYLLDSFVVPFAQPYYILVRKQDGKPFIKHAAEVVAIDYIKPRGCTEPLVRRPDLDKQSADASHYLIGVAC